MVTPIEFVSFNAIILGIQIPSILITWKIKETTRNLSGYKFTVYRGEVATELNAISEELDADIFEFVDYGVDLKNFNRAYYYQVKLKSPDGKIVESHIFNNDHIGDPYGQSIIDDHQFLYKYISGTPVVIFQKKISGIRCSCWDNVLKRAKTGNCPICHGSTYVNGFSKPIPVWVEIGPDAKQAQMTDLKVEYGNKNNITLTNYPLLNIGDIVAEIRTHQYWRVTGVPHQGEKNRSTLLQVASLSLLNRNDIEYNLEIPTEMRNKLLKELLERTKVSEF